MTQFQLASPTNFGGQPTDHCRTLLISIAVFGNRLVPPIQI